MKLPILRSSLAAMADATTAVTMNITRCGSAAELHARRLESNNNTTIIKEGLAVLGSSAVEKGQVFYNPVQEFNRDMSSAVLAVFSKQTSDARQAKSTTTKPSTNFDGIMVLEALAASGFRSCRYGREVPGINKIVANDISETAFATIQHNADQNQVGHLIEPCNMDAVKLMYKLFIDNRLMHAIDIDPYGTSGPFIEPALRALHDGGMLMITSTDSAVMCGNTPEVALKRYHAMSLRMPAHHEMAVRILLGCISRRAATLDRYIRPLVCMQEGFYIRVFVQVFDGALEAKECALNNAYVYNCSQCTSFSLQPLGTRQGENKYVASLAQAVTRGGASGDKCRHCGTAVRMGGPIWTGPLVDVPFAQQVCEFVDTAGFYKSASRIKSKLALLSQELPDVPLFWVVSSMCQAVHCRMISLKLARSAILNAGYRVSGSHCHREGLKTDASQDFLWDMIRAWVATNAVKAGRIEGQPAQSILSRPSTTHDVNFAVRADADPLDDIDKIKAGGARYPDNPQPHWGPKKMASNRKRLPSKNDDTSSASFNDAAEPLQKKSSTVQQSVEAQ